METTRQQKFARLIQKEIGELLQKEGANYYGNAFVTITGVNTSPDLGYVKIFVSVLGTKDRERVIDLLNKNKGDVRRRLGNNIRQQVRHIPELNFFLDESLDYAEKIDKLFKEINKDKENKDSKSDES